MSKLDDRLKKLSEMQGTEIFEKKLKNSEDQLQRSNINLSTEGKANGREIIFKGKQLKVKNISDNKRHEFRNSV